MVTGKFWTFTRITAPNNPITRLLGACDQHLDLAAPAHYVAARPCFDQLEHVCSVDQWYCLDARRADGYADEVWPRRWVIHRTGAAAPCRPKGWNAALLAASST